MPTARCGWVRRALRQGRAVVVNVSPFTIRLTYESGVVTQRCSLGVDAGSKVVGISVTTEQKEVYAAECCLRTDVVDNLSARRMFRNNRRHRKTRYRPVRFNNRKNRKGRLAPSLEQKINSHIQLIRKVCRILPIVSITVETAQFDIQKIKNPTVANEQYQHGEQFGHANVREYVLYRDGHKCQICGKVKDVKLHVHHIESRATGGDSPNNLTTLCTECHASLHAGDVSLKKKRGKSFRDATGMNIMRPTLLKRLRELFPNVQETFGYITKEIRKQYGLEKTHAVDARCISGNADVMPSPNRYQQQCVRTKNRMLHKATVQKGGTCKANQAAKFVCGFQLFDKVQLGDIECFVFGRRTKGSFDVRLLSGDKIHAGISYKKLKLIQKRTTILTTLTRKDGNSSHV